MKNAKKIIMYKIYNKKLTNQIRYDRSNPGLGLPRGSTQINQPLDVLLS